MQRRKYRRGHEKREESWRWPEPIRKGLRRKYRREKSWRWPEAKKAESTQWAPPRRCTLPFDLVVEHILSRLSVRQLCRVRCVCRAWNWVLAAGKTLLPDKAKESWFLMRSQDVNEQTGTRALFAFSSHGCDFPFRLPLAGAKLTSFLGGSDWARLGDRLDFPTTHFIASAGGLICTLVRAVYDGTVYDAIVFNCFTGSVKVLPKPPDQDTIDEFADFSMYMAVDNQDPFQYYVMMASRLLCGHLDFKLAVQVFDSRSGGWKVVNGSPSSPSSTGRLKVADGDFFDSCYHASDGMMDVLAYHAAEDAWSSVQVPLIFNDPRPADMRCVGCWSAPSFLKYEGRLFMGRMLVEDKPYGFEVWELQFSSSGTATLVEVARTPEHLYQPCSYWWTLKAEAFVFSMHLEHGLEGKRPPLVYDIAQSSWYVVPGEEGVDCILVHRPRPSMVWYG